MMKQLRMPKVVIVLLCVLGVGTLYRQVLVSKFLFRDLNSLETAPASCDPLKNSGSQPSFVPWYNETLSTEKDGFDGIEPVIWKNTNEGGGVPCEAWASPHWRVRSRPTTRGFIFTKTFKTGSSTAAGVHLRIAIHEAKRRRKIMQQQSSGGNNETDITMCDVRFKHKPAPQLFQYGKAEPEHSFVWTVLREPTIRYISHFFFFYVSRKGVQPTDALFQSKIQPFHYGKYISMQPMKRRVSGGSRRLDESDEADDETNSDEDPDGASRDEDDDDIGVDDDNEQTESNELTDQYLRNFYNQILQDYHFIALTERWDESMVVLAMMLQIPLSDVLYTKAKGSGRWDDHCYFSIPSFVSSGMKEYFYSETYQKLVHWDYQLYLAANRSLDLTIKSLGPKFDENLQTFRQLREKSAEICDPLAIFPCSEAGEKNNVTNCIYSDFSCANDCLDELSV